VFATALRKIVSNQNRFCIVYKFDYLIFDFQFFSIKIHFLFFLLMHEYSEEDSFIRTNKKIYRVQFEKQKLAIVCQKIDVEKNIE
jgi:negative regulator of genetic competence, sporulation and motility